MDSAVTEFLLKYPNFSQSVEGRYEFVGNVNIKGNFFRVTLFLPEFPVIRNYRCTIFKGVQTYTLKEKSINKNWSAIELIANLPGLIKEPLEFESCVDESALHFKRFLQQLLCVNAKDCQVLVNQSYDLIKFTNFSEYPKHFLELVLTSSFELKVKHHSLPDVTDNAETLFPVFTSIESYLKQFRKLLEDFCDFYTNMNALDELCCVVEPVPVTTKHNWRVFKLNEKVLIRITVNPFSPSSVSVKLIGPTYEIEKYRTTYNNGIKHWNADADVYTNLLRIFELVYFPMKDDDDDESSNDAYCNICYTYRLDGRVPIVACDNPRCDLIFHVPCLKEWFNLNGKTMFAVTLGSCPACKEKLSASFADLLEV